MTKNIYLLLMILYAGFTTGCKPDPAVIPDNLKNPALVGKWFLRHIDVDTEITGNGTVSDIPTVPYETFTGNDYFDFKANNSATYSSSLIGKTYQGYYSARADVSPRSLTFKSGSFSVNFYVRTIAPNELILYQTQTVIENGFTTTVTNTYTYTH